MKKVMGFFVCSDELARKGAARRDQTESTVKGKRNSMVLPASSGVRRALTVP